MNANLIRIGPAMIKSGKSRSGLCQAMAEGTFTKPIKISARAVGWPEDEVETINRAKSRASM